MNKTDDRILLCMPRMSGNEMKYINKAFEGEWVVPLGPDVDAFELDLKNFIESKANSEMHLDKDDISVWPKAEWALDSDKQVVALSSGTAAVHLALKVAGVGPGDEVICQSLTFSASCNPVVYLGATPVFVDSEIDTWNIDPELLESAIKDRIDKTGKKPKAIISVYLYGMPPKVDEIKEIADRYDIPLIEDAAEGLGSRYNGRVGGTFGLMGILSFNGNKIITTSGGGAVICPDKNTAREIMFYATQAREGYPYYQHEEIGYNYRMSNICAAIGRGQMTVIDSYISHHKKIAAFYEDAFRNISGINYHSNPDKKFDSNFWLSTVTIDPDVKVINQDLAYTRKITGAVGGAAATTREAASTTSSSQPNNNVEALRLFLTQRKIESRPLWKPMHLQPVFRSCPAYVNGISESLFHSGLCLPSGPWVTEKDAKRVVESIKMAIIS